MVPDTLTIRWTRRAICDLENIAAFISVTSPVAAQRLLELVRKKVEILARFPYLGREFSPGLRELVVHRNYLLTYRIRPTSIEILQLWHVARQH